MGKKGKSKSKIISFFKRFSLRVTIVSSFITLFIVTNATIIFFTYYKNSQSILNVSEKLLKNSAEIVINKTINYLNPAANMTQFSSYFAKQNSLLTINNETLETFLIGILKQYPQLASFNVGDENGNFLMPKKTGRRTIDTKIITRNSTPQMVLWKRRNTQGKIVKNEKSFFVQYDPRIRPWYKGAKRTGKIFWTDMYIFFTDKIPGITAGYPVYNNGKLWGVFSVDIALRELSRFLKDLRVTKNSEIFIINNKNEIVAYKDATKIVKKAGNKIKSVLITEFKNKNVAASFKAYKKKGPDKKLSFVSGGKKFISLYVSFPKSFGKKWKIALVIPENDFIGPIKRTNTMTLIISLIILFISLLFISIISKMISKPIALLTDETNKIKDFDLEGDVNVKSSVKEIQMMSQAVSNLKTGMRAFKKYVPESLVKTLIRTGEEARLGGRKEELTIFFSDIKGFTTISEGMNPEELMLFLSEYLDELTKIIMEQNGTVDKYIGDAIMAFWGAPIKNDEHAFYGCRAALLCQEKLSELNTKWKSQGKPELFTRIGISTGETVVGNMGSSERMNYTVIGDIVNLSSRLEGVNKIYGTKIIVNHRTYEKVNDKFIFRPVDIVAVKGKNIGIHIYELMAEITSDKAEHYRDISSRFEKGFKKYIEQKWDEAIEVFNNLLNKYPQDEISEIFIKRCEYFKDNPPGEGWKGTIRLTSK